MLIHVPQIDLQLALLDMLQQDLVANHSTIMVTDESLRDLQTVLHREVEEKENVSVVEKFSFDPLWTQNSDDDASYTLLKQARHRSDASLFLYEQWFTAHLGRLTDMHRTFHEEQLSQEAAQQEALREAHESELTTFIAKESQLREELVNNASASLHSAHLNALHDMEWLVESIRTASFLGTIPRGNTGTTAFRNYSR